MAEKLLSVGLDVGTTTTQMVLSELEVENRAGSFSVPDMQITSRKVRQKSPVHFTPLLGHDRVDGEGIRALLEDFYREAGVTPGQVDTGAVIITGETSRKENAAAVLRAIAGFAGDFVAATAGPDLESVLAAKGSGACGYSQKTGKTVLHMDIGGGTSNLSLIREGTIQRTGCMNVGGRLLKFERSGALSYVSPVLHPLTDLRPGDHPSPGQAEAIAQILVHGLEMAAGLREKTDLLDTIWTAEAGLPWEIPTETPVISFSGGVADCIDSSHADRAFGDMGELLGRAIKESRLCRGEYILGAETIRATVIGAGSHTAHLSGSTVFTRGVTLPVKNLPVAVFGREAQDAADLPQRISQKYREKDTEKLVLAFPGYASPRYNQITALAEKIAAAATDEIFLCTETDMAKALGQALSLRLPPGKAIVCIDGLHLQEESFLDIGRPIGPAIPVVIKTLILEKQ